MDTAFAPSLDVDLSSMAVTSSGLYMRDDVVGTGTLVIPPALGDGPRAIGPIPPNATLVFRVELLGV